MRVCVWMDGGTDEKKEVADRRAHIISGLDE
jgi:hypothetical protein